MESLARLYYEVGVFVENDIKNEEEEEEEEEGKQ